MSKKEERGRFRLGKYSTADEYQKEIKDERRILSGYPDYGIEWDKWFYVRWCTVLVGGLGFLIGLIGIMRWVSQFL